MAQRRLAARNHDSDIPYTDSDGHPKTGCLPVGIAVCFASELLSGFVRNQCLLSIGITVWNGPEYALDEESGNSLLPIFSGHKSCLRGDSELIFG